MEDSITDECYPSVVSLRSCIRGVALERPTCAVGIPGHARGELVDSCYRPLGCLRGEYQNSGLDLGERHASAYFSGSVFTLL
jgi:hypothetical protein